MILSNSYKAESGFERAGCTPPPIMPRRASPGVPTNGIKCKNTSQQNIQMMTFKNFNMNDEHQLERKLKEQTLFTFGSRNGYCCFKTK